jgi:hypothetical protein
MLTSGKPFSGYDSGADFWRDNAVSYGIDEAAVICGRYLEMRLKTEVSDSEKQFCRELFTAMYEAAANKRKTIKPVYPYTLQEANERGQTSRYHKSRQRNGECAKAVSEIMALRLNQWNKRNKCGILT